MSVWQTAGSADKVPGPGYSKNDAAGVEAARSKLEPAGSKPDAAGVGAPTEIPLGGGGDSDTRWREVHQKLDLILARVIGVEDVVGELVAGVAHFADERPPRVRRVSMDSRAEAATTTVPLASECGDDVTSKQDGGQQCASDKHKGDMAEDSTTPTASPQTKTPNPAQRPCMETNLTSLVNLDSMSDRSVDPAGFERRKRAPGSLATRVHSQPRLRTVPCPQKALGVPATATNGEASKVATQGPIQRVLGQMDPPGFNDGTDLRVTDATVIERPLLKPRKNGVGPHTPFQIVCNSRILNKNAHIAPTYVLCRFRSGPAQNAGFCTRTMATRSLGRRRQASTTSRAASRNRWSVGPRTANNSFCSKKSIVATRRSFSRTTRTLRQTRRATALF